MTDKDAEYVINYAKANSIKYSTSNFTATVSYSSNIDKTSPVITKEINLALDQKSCDVKLTSNKDIQKVNRMDFI